MSIDDYDLTKFKRWLLPEKRPLEWVIIISHTSEVQTNYK